MNRPRCPLVGHGGAAPGAGFMVRRWQEPPRACLIGTLASMAGDSISLSMNIEVAVASL